MAVSIAHQLGAPVAMRTPQRVASRAHRRAPTSRSALRVCAAVGKGAENIVTIVPYFKVNDMAGFKANIVNGFYPLMAAEEGCLYYNFTFSGEEAHCREAYVGAEAALFHLSNVKEPLDAALTMADLVTLQVHGPAAELEKMKEPLKELPVQYFEQL